MNSFQLALAVIGGGTLVIIGLIGLRTSWSGARINRDRSRRQAELRRRLDERIAARESEQARRYREIGWEGFRRFVVERKVVEDRLGTVCSLYLKPEDRKGLRPIRPGQFLTFRFMMVDSNGRLRPVVRCYSLSFGSEDTLYRISVKRVPAPRDSAHPPGLISSYLHDSVQEGDILDVRPPSGDFCLDTTERGPVVLIGGGIGITPVFSMLRSLIQVENEREVWFFYGVRHSGEHVFKEDLEALAAGRRNVHLVVCYSDPLDTDRKGVDFHEHGRVGVELFQRRLSGKEFDFYLCGPPPMMKSIVEGLDAWEVPEGRVHFEAFGPASIRRKAQPVVDGAEERVFVVDFERSGSKLRWDGKLDHILGLAETNDIPINAGCRSGNCGTCAVVLKRGEVTYVTKPGAQIEPGTCLTCIAVPVSDLLIDA